MFHYSALQFKFTMSLIIVFILIAVLWHKISQSEDELLSVTLESTSTAFASKAMHIHAQWLMTGKGDLISLKERSIGQEQGYEQLTYRVNQFGWPDLLIEHDACARIWQQMTGIGLEILNKPLAVIEIKDDNKPQARICRYHINAAHYIEYNSGNGRIVNKN